MTIDEIVELTLGHLMHDGLDDIFKPPLLNEPIEQIHLGNPNFANPLRTLAKQFLERLKAREFNPPLHLNVPKSRHTYRRASLLDIRDLVRYTALVISLAECIEANRIRKEERIVFSSRFTRALPCFDRAYGHGEFRHQSDLHTKSGQFSVKIYTDISNFFDRLNLHRLEGTLIDIGCPRKPVSTLNEILLHWANRNSYGIPVGCDASRILAEAMLIPVDRKLVLEGITFVRYVDDYRIFARDFAEGHAHLAFLTSALEEEGLFINWSKTRITSVEAEKSETDPGDPNRNTGRQGFDAIDEAEVIETTQLIKSGYKTRIARYYKKPGEEAIRRLRKNNINEILSKSLIDDPDEDDLKEFIKTFIYGTDRQVPMVFRLTDRHVHMIAYLADALTKESHRFSPEERQELGNGLAERYQRLKGLEYYRLCIARVLSHPNFRQEATFRRWLAELPVTTNPAFLKELIGFFGPALTRDSIRELVRGSLNYHPAVTRVIVSYALSSDLCLYGERRSWAKSWMQSSNDILVRAVCQPFLKPEPASDAGATDEDLAPAG